MGSAAEFKAMCEFLNEKKIPLTGLVDSVFKGLDSADEAFDKMKNGHQFGNFRRTIFKASIPLIYQVNWSLPFHAMTTENSERLDRTRGQPAFGWFRKVVWIMRGIFCTSETSVLYGFSFIGLQTSFYR
jgi:hypothetical protein